MHKGSSSTQMASAIESAFAALDQFDGQLSLPAIIDWFREEPLTLQDLAGYLTFNPARYVRNLVHDGPAYQALVLCWRNGQRSPIHNHRGSRCGVKILRASRRRRSSPGRRTGWCFPWARGTWRQATPAHRRTRISIRCPICRPAARIW